MADEKKNAQVVNGVNDDIKEMKSLTILRKRVVSDGAKSENGFRLAGGNTGVILRKDGNDFYMLTTKDGQAQNGEWNTLRPFSFNLKTGRVSLRNGLDISGGTFVSRNAGITAQTTGPDPLIKGQEYNAPEISTAFTPGNTTVKVLMGARISKDNQEHGLISYRDRQGQWNEVRLKKNAELEVGQLTRLNPEGWITLAGNRKVNDVGDYKTNGVWFQGRGNLSADFYHYEKTGHNHYLGLHVANGGADGWFKFRNDGDFFANNNLHAGNASLAADGNINGPLWGGWLNIAGQELGAPIPSQIADKLRGREFANFDAFRRAVWGEVGKEPTLNSQFNGSNQKSLSKGYSPFPPEAEQVGGRTRYELHHITPVKDGGAVYDIDNIGILTPKRHIDLHKNGE